MRIKDILTTQKRPEPTENKLRILQFCTFCQKIQQRASGPEESASGVTYLSMRIHPKICRNFTQWFKKGRSWSIVVTYPADTERKLKVHKTFRRLPGCLLNVLCTFSLRPVSTRQLSSVSRLCSNTSSPDVYRRKRRILKEL